MREKITFETNLHSGKVIAKNTLINLVGQLLPLVVGIVTIPLIIKGLGTDRFGVLTLAWMVIGYFSLFDLGLGRALTQIIATSLGNNNVKKLPGLVWTALVIMFFMGVVGMVIAGMLSPFMIAMVFKMPDELRPESLHAFYILSASIPIVILSSGFVGILSAYQRFDLINVVRVPLGLASFIVPLLVLPFSTSIAPITFFLALTRLVSCVAQYRLCLLVMPLLSTEKNFMFEEIKPLFRFGGWMTISNIVGPLMVYLDRFVIGAVISVTAVAYYATPYEMVTKLWVISGALVASLFPAFAAGNTRDGNSIILLLSKSTAAIFILIFPIVLVIVTFSQEGLMFWLGKNFANNSATVLQLLAAGVFINCFAQVLFALIQGRGRSDITAKIHLLEIIFYLPLFWWVLKHYGIAGAAFMWMLRVTVDGILLLLAAKYLMPSANNIALKLSGYVIVPSIALLMCGLPDSLKVRLILFGLTCVVFSVFTFFYMRRNGIHGIMSSTVRIREATHTS